MAWTRGTCDGKDNGADQISSQTRCIRMAPPQQRRTVHHLLLNLYDQAILAIWSSFAAHHARHSSSSLKFYILKLPPFYWRYFIH